MNNMKSPKYDFNGFPGSKWTYGRTDRPSCIDNWTLLKRVRNAELCLKVRRPLHGLWSIVPKTSLFPLFCSPFSFSPPHSSDSSGEGVGGSSQSPPSSVISAAEKEGLTEDAVRKYLTRKPLTTIDLLAKFKNKKSAMTQEQLVQVMAYYLRVSKYWKEGSKLVQWQLNCTALKGPWLYGC